MKRKESKTQPRKESKDSGGLSRRGFLQTMGVAGAALTLPGRSEAKETLEEPPAVLVDTTECIGCRNCEFVCAQTNGLDEPSDDEALLEQERRTSETQWTVVNRYDTDKGEFYVKRQCMHCLQPACASACLTKAMYKTPEGPVVWRGNKCMGCRFCMVSCPFGSPKFEYHSYNPRIQKCRLCLDRLKEGDKPACVEECMGDAMLFGPRSEMITEGRRRILENPDKYVNHIYGEHEAGGTTWLYLSAVPFDQIGFNTQLQDESYPKLTSEFLYGVPVTLIVVPSLLYGISNATKNGRES